RLTDDPYLETDPAWSPDGKSLAYSSDRDGFMNIWVRDVQSGVDRQITRGSAAAMQAAWSPDGSRIAFSDPEGQIQVVDVRSGAVTRVHDHLNDAGRASWSPDGRALVVSSLKVYSTRFREGTNQVLRVSLEGEPDRWFEPMPHKSAGMREDHGPVWSPDGAQMAAIIDGLLTVWPVAGVVEGTRIKSVEPHRDALQTGTVVDASNQTVIPGLIEIHTHLSKEYGEALGRIFLAWGITTVRNPATNTFETLETREAYESGRRVGPRLFSTGEPFDGTRVYYAGGSSLDDTGQLPLVLQRAKDFDFDFVKT